MLKKLNTIIFFVLFLTFTDQLAAEDKSLDQTSQVETLYEQENQELVDEDVTKPVMEPERKESLEIEPITEIEKKKLQVPGKKERVLIGWVEEVHFIEYNLFLDTKVTPGTLGNSLHADNIVANKALKQVSFEIEDKTGKKKKITKKYKSYKNGKYSVKFQLCVANRSLELDFKISDRSSFNQAVRIGRDSIAGLFIVDPASTKLTKPSC